MTQVDNVLREGFDKAMARAEGELDQHQRAIAAIREAASREWDGTAELAEARAALNALPPDNSARARPKIAVTREDVRQAAVAIRSARDGAAIVSPRRPSLSDAAHEAAAPSGARATTPAPRNKDARVA